MDIINEIRKEYLKDYDRTYEEVKMHDQIIQKYREEWNKLNNKPRPLTLNDSYPIRNPHTEMIRFVPVLCAFLQIPYLNSVCF